MVTRALSFDLKQLHPSTSQREKKMCPVNVRRHGSFNNREKSHMVTVLWDSPCLPCDWARDFPPNKLEDVIVDLNGQGKCLESFSQSGGVLSHHLEGFCLLPSQCVEADLTCFCLLLGCADPLCGKTTNSKRGTQLISCLDLKPNPFPQSTAINSPPPLSQQQCHPLSSYINIHTYFHQSQIDSHHRHGE